MRRLRWFLLGTAVLLLGAWRLSAPVVIEVALPQDQPDPANGERMFHAGGCASCHATPDADDETLLGGGLALASPAGTFRVPNISSHERDGIGGWSEREFINAMTQGVSPGGRHYYPSFPWTAYARMNLSDLADLKAFLDSLPPVVGRPAGHELAFPWNIRRGIGLWKRLFFDTEPVVKTTNELAERGRYLVEGVGHCGECHTPRNAGLALDRQRWLAGAPALDGEGRVPALNPAGLGAWSEADIIYFLETGIDPEFDVVGSHMVAVQENLARLPPEDLRAIAAYLKSLPDTRGNPP